MKLCFSVDNDRYFLPTGLHFFKCVKGLTLQLQISDLPIPRIIPTGLGFKNASLTSFRGLSYCLEFCRFFQDRFVAVIDCMHCCFA